MRLELVRKMLLTMMHAFKPLRKAFKETVFDRLKAMIFDDPMHIEAQLIKEALVDKMKVVTFEDPMRAEAKLIQLMTVMIEARRRVEAKALEEPL